MAIVEFQRLTKPVAGDHADDLDDLGFAPVFAQLGEHLVGDGVGHSPCGGANPERRPFGWAKQRTCRGIRDCRELLRATPKCRAPLAVCAME